MGNGINERSTPLSLFEPLHKEFRFTLDGAASHERHLLPTYSTLEGTFFRDCGALIDRRDGLAAPWETERVFLNPPYGRGLLEPFVKRAASGEADLVVALLPVRTEQPWFHDYVLAKDAEIRFIRGRVKYDGLGAAPFPSMLVVWR